MAKRRKKKMKSMNRTVPGLTVAGEALTPNQFKARFNTLHEANAQLRKERVNTHRYLAMLSRELTPMRDSLLEVDELGKSEINDVVDVLDRLLEPLEVTTPETEGAPETEEADAPPEQGEEQAS